MFIARINKKYLPSQSLHRTDIHYFIYCDECEQTDTKLWLLLNSLLDFFQLKEKSANF